MVLALTIAMGLLAVFLTSLWGRGLVEWISTIKARALGAFVGSLVMVLWRPGHDTKRRLAVRLFVGFIIGFVSAPALLYWLEWAETIDSLLFAGTVCGSVGVMLVQVMHTRWFARMLRQRAAKFIAEDAQE